jgi:hypothetical protein
VSSEFGDLGGGGGGGGNGGNNLQKHRTAILSATRPLNSQTDPNTLQVENHKTVKMKVKN